MSKKLLAISSIVLMNILTMSLAYAGTSEPETPPSSAVPQAESTIPNPTVINQTLPSIRPDEIEKAAASESQAKMEIPAELAKVSQSIDPKS